MLFDWFELDDCSETDRDGAVEAASLSQADFVFVEGVPLRSPLRRQFIRFPAWIKQRVRRAGSWADQLAALPRSTRKRIQGYLRNLEVRCVVRTDEAGFQSLYDDLYRPFVVRRFGESALIVPRERFLKECAEGELVELEISRKLVAGALMRRVGRTTTMVWAGYRLDGSGQREHGSSDLLDYFALLFAHLRGARWWDLGPSRPDLSNGLLVNKSKWSAEVFAGFAPQRQILVRFDYLGELGRAFFDNHVPLIQFGRNISALSCLRESSDVLPLAARLRVRAARGVRRVCLVAVPDADFAVDAFPEAIASLLDVHAARTNQQFADVVNALQWL